MRNRTMSVLVTTALVSALAVAGAATATAQDDGTTAPDTGHPLSDTADAIGSVLTGGTTSVRPSDVVTVTSSHRTFTGQGEGGAHPAAPTYREDLVPVGSAAKVTSVMDSTSGTTTRLEVDGLLPEREYGAHVHTDPCGSDPTDAGGHYQHRPDPNQPSTDPAYANPDNEIWLDFTTDDTGAAKVESSSDWFFGERRPSSVVIHEHHTLTGEGEAGVAGERLACLTFGF